MNHAEFIYPSYLLTIAGLAGALLWSWRSMVSAERAAAALRRDRQARDGR